ncbi:MAG: sirohydrochlorin cobaltochelatase [Bacteroidaceae bacterium]|nr:sirohydrochlorin cobaltochelatase [Bacteroidaceae bacterium]
MKISLTIILTFLGMLSLHAQNISDSALFSQLKEGKKGAVVAVHIGTDDASVSAHTIDVFNEQLQKEFPQQAFFSVVTSNASLSRQLTELAKDGFTHLLIQPSFIVDDVEMTVLRQEVIQIRSEFMDIRIGEPLLSSEEDCQTIIKAISQKYGGKNANLLLGEGSSYMTQAFNSPYTFIQYAISSPSMLKMLKGDWYVATLNGYPTLQNAIERMQANKEKKVNIITLHFSPSSTIQNEVAETMKSQILPAGFKATATHQSLGELPEVIDVFMEHARYAATHRSLSPIEEKFSHSYHY